MTVGAYTETVTLALTETAKYLGFLILVVLAIRLWRRTALFAARGRIVNIVLALLCTGLAATAGCLSICTSLARLNLHYAKRAFEDGKVQAALILYRDSSAKWKTPDSVGGEGLCLLWLGNANPGRTLLDEAGRMRHGANTAFEQFNEGLFWYINGQPERAERLLESASGELLFRWNAVKLLAAIQVDEGKFDAAGQRIAPYEQMADTGPDQAYVLISLARHNGRLAEARQLLAQYPPDKVGDFWKGRFETLHSQIQ